MTTPIAKKPYAGSECVKYATSIQELKELALRMAYSFTLSGNNSHCYDKEVAVFVRDILRDALSAAGHRPQPQEGEGVDKESLGYDLDSLSTLFCYLPDTWEVWPWDNDLQHFYGSRLVTRLCPGLGNISIIVDVD